MGGELLTIEVTVLPGNGKLTITGKLGDVMRESAQAAISYVRSRWQELGLERDFYPKLDIHIHVPEGAIPKDGPSAGITIATALASALTGRAVDRDLAMTGEITLRGRVLPIGGLKEKTLGAIRAGIRTVIIPEKNRKELSELSKNIRRKLKFELVQNMDQVLPLAFDGEAPRPLPHIEDAPEQSTDQSPEQSTDQSTETDPGHETTKNISVEDTGAEAEKAPPAKEDNASIGD